MQRLLLNICRGCLHICGNAFSDIKRPSKVGGSAAVARRHREQFGVWAPGEREKTVRGIS